MKIGRVNLVNTTSSSINIREGASVSSKDVGDLHSGTILLYEESTTPGWWKIDWEGKERFVSKQYVEFTDVLNFDKPADAGGTIWLTADELRQAIEWERELGINLGVSATYATRIADLMQAALERSLNRAT